MPRKERLRVVQAARKQIKLIRDKRKKNASMKQKDLTAVKADDEGEDPVELMKESSPLPKISTTKRENNRAGSEGVVKICRLIQLSAEKNGVSKKSECEKYFRENSALLNRYGIHSSRTLENRCSNTRPNRVRGIKNSTDAPCPIPIDFWNKLNHITSI